MLTGLYGSGAILVRESVRRRGLGWANILLLGAAYGVLEEGLVITSWFNPYWPDAAALGNYGRFLDTNWLWALALTLTHAVLSITLPIVLVEAIFPGQAKRRWLGCRGVVAFAILLACTALVDFSYFGFVAFRARGYTHPPSTYVTALAAAIGLVWLGLHLRLSPPHRRTFEPTPHLWTLRVAAFVTTCSFWCSLWILHALIPIPAVTLLVMVGIVALAAWHVYRWATLPGWGIRHRLALASGMVGFSVLVASPLLEFVVHPTGKATTGMTAAGVLWLVGLIWLEQHAAGNP